MSEPPIVGIATPPGWFDPTPAELAKLSAVPIKTQQSLIDVPALNYDDLNALAAAEAQVARTVNLLGLTVTDVIGMTGTPFVWAGLTTEADVRARQARLTQAAGCPVAMAGTAVIDALRSLEAKRIAVAAPYYTAPWRDQAELMLSAAGFEVLAVRSVDQQGLSGPITSIHDHENFSDEDIVLESLRALAQGTPEAQAFVSLGSGVRTLNITKILEGELDCPFVAPDTALYWSISKILRLPLKLGTLGLLETTL